MGQPFFKLYIFVSWREFATRVCRRQWKISLRDTRFVKTREQKTYQLLSSLIRKCWNRCIYHRFLFQFLQYHFNTFV